MNERRWVSNSGHPEAAVLLLHLDGELDNREAAEVAHHLQDCWECRTHSERLQRGVYTYMNYRNGFLLPSVPTRPPTKGRFHRRLDEAASSQEHRSMLDRLLNLFRPIPRFRFHPGSGRAGWIAATVSAAVIAALYLLPIVHPPALNAAEVLHRAILSERATETGTRQVVHQRIRIRRGKQTVERDIYSSESRPVVNASPLDPELNHALGEANIDWNQPLNAKRFSAWRDALAQERDTVTESVDSVTLRTMPMGEGPIRYASLTLLRSDWHPIAERFEFSDEPPLEVLEISREVRREETAPEIAAHLPIASAPAVPPTTAAPEPSETDLERSEISVREAMHQLGADRNELPDIVIEDHHVDVRATADTDDRQRELVASIEGVPYVLPEIASPGAAVTARPTGAVSPVPRPASPPSASYPTIPPLAKELWDYRGSMEAANNYLDTVRESYFQTLADAGALSRLAQRYSQNEWDRIPADVQERVNRLAADYIQALQKDAPEYLRRLSDPVEEMVRRTGSVSPPLSDGMAAGCAQWQSLAGRLVTDLQQAQTSFRRLFVVDQTDTPLTLTADGLLSEVVRLRSSLNEELRALCLP